MALEINTLIKERRHVSDDGCDYCATFIGNWNAAARARSGACYQPPVKPPVVCSPKTETGAVVKIGNRNVYGRKVITGVYQLHHSGRSAVQIAHMLKMPVYRVEHLLKRGTRVHREIFRQVSTQPLPTEADRGYRAGAGLVRRGDLYLDGKCGAYLAVVLELFARWAGPCRRRRTRHSRSKRCRWPRSFGVSQQA